jgi:hypothetical protein
LARKINSNRNDFHLATLCRLGLGLGLGLGHAWVTQASRLGHPWVELNKWFCLQQKLKKKGGGLWLKNAAEGRKRSGGPGNRA